MPSLPVIQETLPELRPGRADIAADVDPVAVAENVVDDAIGIRQLSSNLAGGEDLVEFVRLEAYCDDCLRGGAAVAPAPIGVHAADGAWQAVGTAVEVDGAGFAFVSGHDSECGAIGGGDGIAHVNDGGDEFGPANLHVVLMSCCVLQAPPRGIGGGKGEKEGGKDQAGDPERCPCCTQEPGLPLRRERPEPGFGP